MGFDINGNTLSASGSNLVVGTNSVATAAQWNTNGTFRKFYVQAAQGSWGGVGSTNNATLPEPITGLSINLGTIGANTTSNYRFTAPITGVYAFHFASITNGQNNFNGRITKNLGQYSSGSGSFPSGTGLGRADGNWSTASSCVTDRLNAGDTVEWGTDGGGITHHGGVHAGMYVIQVG
jgi:hypothetical protein